MRSVLAALALGLLLSVPPQVAAQSCVGDCDGDDTVTIAELIISVDIALGTRARGDCLAFACEECAPGPGRLLPQIACLIQAVGNSLDGCAGLACSTDADCDDGNPCSLDSCTPEGCTHLCMCV